MKLNESALQKKFFDWVSSTEEIELEWIDMLSQLEYVGCRKIVRSLSFGRVTARELQHISEEALHSLQLKKIVDRRSSAKETWKNAGLAALGFDYFQTLDQQVSGLLGEEYSPYEGVSWAVEQRVLQLYPAYAKYTSIAEVKKVLAQILRQEKRHGKQFDRADLPKGFREKAVRMEKRLWAEFLKKSIDYIRNNSLERSLPSTAVHSSSAALH